MGRPEEEEGYAGPSGPRSLALCMDGGCFGHRCLGCRSFCVSETWGDETHGRGLLALLCCNVTPQRATCGATVCAALRVSSFAIMQVPLVRFVFGIPQDCFVVRFLSFLGIVRYHSVGLLPFSSSSLRRGHSFTSILVPFQVFPKNPSSFDSSKQAQGKERRLVIIPPK